MMDLKRQPGSSYNTRCTLQHKLMQTVRERCDG